MTDSCDHLFRREAGRIVATLTRIFGVQNLALAEDVVQDAFCRALDVWKYRGMPDNPGAWLMTTAKNRALDVLRRQRTALTFEPELARHFENAHALEPAVDELFDEHAIRDDLLRMMFSCCDPRLPEEAQIALVLHILCGFSAHEVAAAFVTTHAAMEKRITRAKKTLAGSKRLFDTTAAEQCSTRLPAVHRALYLLFNEGYHGASPQSAVRADLCIEAMRLVAVLLEHPSVSTPATCALRALMCLHASRLPARIDATGNLSSLFDQDRSLWDQPLVREGLHYLDQSAHGSEVTEYHVEAGIASVHAAAPSAAETDWPLIVSLYDRLMAIRPSPIVALNRAIAIAERDSPAAGLAEIRRIADVDRLARYPFHHAALGELERRCGRFDAAQHHFRDALALARSPMEQRFLEQRLALCL